MEFSFGSIWTDAPSVSKTPMPQKSLRLAAPPRRLNSDSAMCYGSPKGSPMKSAVDGLERPLRTPLRTIQTNTIDTPLRSFGAVKGTPMKSLKDRMEGPPRTVLPSKVTVNTPHLKRSASPQIPIYVDDETGSSTSALAPIERPKTRESGDETGSSASALAYIERPKTRESGDATVCPPPQTVHEIKETPLRIYPATSDNPVEITRKKIDEIIADIHSDPSNELPEPEIIGDPFWEEDYDEFIDLNCLMKSVDFWNSTGRQSTLSADDLSQIFEDKVDLTQFDNNLDCTINIHSPPALEEMTVEFPWD